jgi:co-chaperonin GroES (HSP10)
LQVNVGDVAVFFRKAAVEIQFEGDKFLVVPHAALLVVVRESRVPDRLPERL